AGVLGGLGAGIGIGLLLGRLLSRRSVESQVAAKLAGEYAHRQARAAAVAKDTAAPLAGGGSSVGGHVERPGDGRAEEAAASHRDGVRTTVLYDPDPHAASWSDVVARDEGALASDGDVWPPVDRDTSKPYIISAEEFAEPGPGDDIYEKISVAWYQGDDI